MSKPIRGIDGSAAHYVGKCRCSLFVVQTVNGMFFQYGEEGIDSHFENVPERREEYRALRRDGCISGPCESRERAIDVFQKPVAIQFYVWEGDKLLHDQCRTEPV